MTPTAWSQGLKNAALCGTGVLLLWCASTAAISLIFHQPLFDSLKFAFAAVWSLAWLVFLVTWFRGRMAAGVVLLDCGPHPVWWLFLTEAILFLFLGLTGSFAPLSVPRANAIAGPALTVSFTVYWLIMATGRLQVRESGIWQYWSLLRWGKIASYEWANDSTLLVRTKGPFSWFRGALPIPPEHKQAVEDFLTNRCPTQALQCLQRGDQ